MSKRQVLMLIGIWVIIFPILGLPTLWRQVVGVLTGVVIVGITLTLRPEQPLS